MSAVDRSIKVNGLKYGVVLGVVLLVIAISLFYFITRVAVSPILFVIAPIIFSIAIPIAVVVLLCFKQRSDMGGYWSFRQATTGIFIMFLTAYAIQTLGRDLLFARIIEPQMAQKTEVATINAMKRAQLNKTQLNSNIAQVQEEFDAQKNVTPGSVIQAMAISIIFIFIFALIFGSLFKREQPVYTN